MSKSALQKYNEKRDFTITSEPSGDIVAKKSTELVFTVQKHAARRLHYDFRLEWNGVLWSWALPKGPSYYSKDKRLAVRTEDHPVSYFDYEGIIPEAQYGAGAVMLWDSGSWEPLDKAPAKCIRNGKLNFRLHGEKLHGEWTLVRMKTKDQKRENWLFLKSADEYAIEKADENFLEKTDYSVKTGRSFKAIAAGTKLKKSASAASKSKPDKTSLQALEKKYKAPQLATLVDNPPESDKWIHEVKYDGYRILVYVLNGQVRINTRNGHDWTDKFTPLRDAFQQLKINSLVIDGEAVVHNAKGVSDFKALQNSISDINEDIQGYFFDVLYLDGQDFSQNEFSERRTALEKLFKKMPKGPVLISEIIEGKASKVLDKACQLGLEGIISKRKDAPYVQKRARSWVKSKCDMRQEFLICGLIPSTSLSESVGSLHLGYYQNDEFLYAGKVGTGFDQKTAKSLYQDLMKLKIKNHPFSHTPDGQHKGTLWVKPQKLCEVKFAMWTESGKVRHASYQGLREDKPPEEIRKEDPLKSGLKDKASKNNTNKRKVEGIMISHADREIFPDAHITKGELAEFYAVMGEHILASVKNRPASVVRCPGGIDKQCFFQRSKGKGMPEHIYALDVTHENKTHEYFYIKNVEGLVSLVQMGGIEIHPWNVLIDKTEKPDRIIFDLDPDEAIPFEAIKLAAQNIKNRLENVGLQSFLKCTGGKGLHVTVPIQRRQTWDTVKSFARNFSKQMVEDLPDVYTINMSKKKRVGKIFIDYLRNDFASTAVMDYCVRARPGAPIAVPLDWEELADLEAANQFSIADVISRLEKNRLYAYPDVQQNLTQKILKQF